MQQEAHREVDDQSRKGERTMNRRRFIATAGAAVTAGAAIAMTEGKPATVSFD
jgi:hypothetical protein